MSRATTQLCIALALATAMVVSAAHTLQAQTAAKPAAPAPAAQKAPPAPPPMKMAAGPKMTDAQKIANAMSAAPPDVGKNATIMDWPEDMAKGQPKQLRAGTNGWTCYPKMPDATSALGDDPMCLDKAWQGWAGAFMSKGTPPAGTSGIAYMLKGDKGASNTDPFASAPTPTNQWVVSPSHIMVLFPDPKTLDGFSTDPKNGGPFVMWKGTPYAHLMVPISPTKAAAMPGK